MLRTAGARSARFRRIREIARGGMGRVVEALDLELDRTVALKEVLDDRPDARRRFEREIAITARLEHPSIVPLYDAGASPSGERFYVMRKLSGAPLDEVIGSAASLDQRLGVLPNVLAVADAIAHAHGRGVIHRDLKPSNVLVGDFGETVVIDWGLAKVIDELEEIAGPLRGAGCGDAPLASATNAGAVIGTPGFMAPEQALGDPVDARADVYALGACLYFVLAGRAPLAGDEREVLRRTVRGDVPALRGVAAELVTIVEKAMARDPRDRYLDAGGVGEDLRRFLAGQLVASHRYGVAHRIARWLRRHRTIAVAAAVAVAISIAGGAFALRRIVAEQRRTAAALERERERADDLVVAQAAGRLDVDPTLAVATLQQLPAESPRWREVGPLLAEARARGVAMGYPGHGAGSTWIDFAPRDHRVLTAGNGVVRIADLAARTTKTVLEDRRLIRARWCGGAIVASIRGAALVIDPVTGARDALAWPGELTSVAATGDGVLAFTDAAGKLAVVELGGVPIAARPVVVPLPSFAATVWSSRSGDWLVVQDAADRATLLRRRGRLAWEVAWTTAEETHMPAFDASERRLAIVAGAGIIELDLETPAVARRWPAQRAIMLQYAGAALHAVTSEGIRRLDDGGASTSLASLDRFGLHVLGDAAGGLAVLETSRRIAILRGTSRTAIHAPIELAEVAARGRFLVAAGASQVLAWDLDEVLPARAEVPSTTGLAFAAGDTLLSVGTQLHDAGVPVHRYTIGRVPLVGSVQRLGLVAHVFAELRTLGDGVVALSTPRMPLALVDGTAPLRIPDVTAATLVDRATIAVGTASGELALVDRSAQRACVAARPADGGACDRATRSRTRLMQLGAPIVEIAARDGTIVALGGNGELRRLGPHGRAAHTHARADAIAIANTGTVYLAQATRLLAWDGGGEPELVATLPLPIISLRGVARDRIAIATADRALRLYDPATRDVRLVLPAAAELAIGDTVAAGALDGGIAAVDLVTGTRWTIAEHFAPVSGGLAISPDETALIAGDREALHRFALVLPDRAWAERATNAAPPRAARGAIEWRAMPASR